MYGGLSINNNYGPSKYVFDIYLTFFLCQPCPKMSKIEKNVKKMSNVKKSVKKNNFEGP